MLQLLTMRNDDVGDGDDDYGEVGCDDDDEEGGGRGGAGRSACYGLTVGPSWLKLAAMCAQARLRETSAQFLAVCQAPCAHRPGARRATMQRRCLGPMAVTLNRFVHIFDIVESLCV